MNDSKLKGANESCFCVINSLLGLKTITHQTKEENTICHKDIILALLSFLFGKKMDNLLLLETLFLKESFGHILETTRLNSSSSLSLSLSLSLFFWRRELLF